MTTHRPADRKVISGDDPRGPDPPLPSNTRRRGRRLAISSHPMGMTFAMVFGQHLPTLALVSLGASEAVIGLQSALKVADLLQLPTLRWVAVASKRRILVWGHVFALVGGLPLLAFPMLLGLARDGHPWAAWIALSAFAWVTVGQRVSDTVWFPLLRGYMEPGGIGRFFGTIRSVWHFALIIYYIGALAWLEGHPDAFGVLFGAAWACGVLRLAFIVRLPERSERTGQRIRVREAFALIRNDPRLRSYLLGSTWATAVRVSVLPFVIVMMRREVGFTSADVILTTIASFAGGLASLYVWGHVVDRVGPSPVFRSSCLGLAILTALLAGVSGPGTATLVGLVAFFFCYSILVSGFGVADTHVLFALTPPEAPARTLVVASVVVGALSSLAPIGIGIGLETALASATRPLFVYHVFFAVAALIQAFAYLPLRGLGESLDAERTRTAL